MLVALVTGGANGMGRSTSLGLAHAGFRVLATDIDEGGLSSLEREARDTGLALECARLDVCDETDVAGAFERIARTHQRIDVLVNNAGGAASVGPLSTTSLADWQANLQLNLTSQFLCIRAVLPTMSRQKSGSIINIASTSVASGITASHYGQTGSGNLVAYVAAKGGVVALTRALAREVGETGVRVNAVAPGFTPSERARAMFAQPTMDRIVEDQAFRREQRVGDVVGTIVFLASPASEFITGQVINVDGGASMG